ncbi:MAG TPA: dockerin type I domain-containing protein [Pirellulaceae bacterium]|nr:dockerin type I domain-containing protein [Pirellulaceae bacterium]
MTDANSTDFAGGTLTVSITTNGTSSDLLEVLAAGQITVTNQAIAFAGDAIGTITPGSGESGTPLVITFTGAAATPTAIRALLQSIAYRNSSQQPSPLPRSVEWRITDGDGGTSNLVSSTIHVTATNDAPTLNITATASSYTAGTPATLIDPAALISDIDATVLAGATLQVSITNSALGDIIDVASQGTNSGEISVSADKILYEASEIGTFTASNGLQFSFNGTATLAAVQALLRRLSYRNALNLPQLGQRAITLQFYEGDATAAELRTAHVNLLAAPVAIIDANLPGGNGQANGVADTFRLVRNNDSIELYQNASVTPSQTFPLATTQGIVLRGSLDADTLIIDQSGGLLTLPITFTGHGGSHDTLIVQGTSADDVLHTLSSGATVAVQGTSLDITWTDPNAAAGDELIINGGEGHDTLDAQLLAADRVRLTLHGGAGNDTLLGSLGSDALDGGADFDTLLISGTSGNDVIRVQQPDATSLITTFNTLIDTDTLTSGSIERLHLQAGDGDDELQVELGDAITFPLAVLITGGAGDDTLQLVDVGQADLILYQQGEAVTIGPRSATPLRISFSEVNTVRFLDDAGEPVAADFPQSRLLLLPLEVLPNDSLLTATPLSANGTSIVAAIDPTTDSDFYRVQADVTGTLDVRVLFSQLDLVPVSLRPGLPGAGDLRLQLFDSAGTLIIDQTSPYGSEGTTDNERLRFPVVQGEIYYVRVSGVTTDAINGYTISATNAAATVPFELQLAGSATQQTSDLTPKLTFRLDDSWLLDDLPGNLPDERIGIPFQAAAVEPGYRVAIFDSNAFLGYATATTNPPTGDYTFDCSPLTPGSHHFTAKVEIVSLTESSSFGVASAALSVLIDETGPSVASVRLPQSAFNLFASQPASWGPTPLVSELELVFHDGPQRDSGLLTAFALNATLAAQTQHYELRGELHGLITIASIAIDQTIDADGIAISSVRLSFAQPLPDDRYTLTVFDSLSDVAGNALTGGDYVTSFFVDSRSELGTWQSGATGVDLNGNGSFDPGATPAVLNADLTYHFGTAADAIFAGNFHIAALGAANGFDKLAAYGVVGGQHRFVIDTDHDGVPDNVPGLFPLVGASLSVLNISGLPFAGRFDGNNLNGDEVGLFANDTWYFDTNHNYVLDSDDAQLVSELRGVPIVGDFDGDGFDDLATWHDGHFQIDLARGVARGWDGSADFTVRFDLGSAQARPIATDWNRDGIDDLGLWLPDSNTSPDTAQWYFVLSGEQADGTPIPLVLSGSVPDAPEHRVRWDEANQERSFVFTPGAGDFALLFGVKTALPLVGNFDPLPQKAASGSPGQFTNPTNPLDVDNDGEITVTDAAYLVNNINAFGFRTLTSTLRTPDGPFYDVDGDRQITAIDALTIINYLNTRGSGEPPAELDDTPSLANQTQSLEWDAPVVTKWTAPLTLPNSDTIEPTVAPLWLPPLWLLPSADDDLTEEPAFALDTNEWEELFEHLAQGLSY